MSFEFLDDIDIQAISEEAYKNMQQSQKLLGISLNILIFKENGE